jgi:hypothetical protein
MKNKEIINDYLISIYRFTSNDDGWCVHHIYYDKNITLQKLINDIEYIFPDMGATEVVTNWWVLNIKTTTDRIMWFMDKYRLKLGNKMDKAWDIVDGGGGEFNIKYLMNHLPEHHNEQGIMIIFNEWFDEKLLESNMYLMGIKK